MCIGLTHRCTGQAVEQREKTAPSISSLGEAAFKDILATELNHKTVQLKIKKLTLATLIYSPVRNCANICYRWMEKACSEQTMERIQISKHS
jgi:hypothetical protein